jgi:hypothetical protein
VSFADLLPVVDVRDVHACADNIFQASARALERGFDVLEDLYGLCVGVSNTDNLAVLVGGGCASYMHSVAYANGTRVANDGFPWGAG